MADDARDQLLSTKRQENFELSRKMNDAPGRFGLFTSPAPLAVSDLQFEQKKPRLNPESDVKEVKIDPPNIRTGPMKKGAGDQILFSKPTYTAIGDPFKEAAQTMLRKTNTKAHVDEKAFRPAKHFRQPTNAAYVHMKEFEHVQKNFRSEENPREVEIAPRNLLTNPPKVGKVGANTSFGGMVPYMEDDYNRPKYQATEVRVRGEEIIEKTHGGKNFSQKVAQTAVFNTNKAVIGEDVHIPHREPKPKPAPLMEHDKPFKPSHPPKRGYNSPLGAFPQYMENPLKPVTRRVEEEDDRKKFRPTHNSKTRPTPSIQTNMRNLKASFPSIFKK